MKRAFILSILFVQITMLCAQDEAHVQVSGMRPEAGQDIRGYVYLDSIAHPNCIVMEKNAQGKAVNATSTDANGSFSLKIVNPDDLIHVNAYVYSPKQKKIINYKAKVKHAGMEFMGYDDFKHEINGSDFKQTNITNNVPKSVIKPESGDMIRGRVYVNNIQKGGCIVAERDNRGKLINVTATDGAGDFVLYLVNPRNKTWIYHSS